MKTCVFPSSLRNTAECITRSRSRSKHVRKGSGSSCRSRFPAPPAWVAPAASVLSSIASLSSRRIGATTKGFEVSTSCATRTEGSMLEVKPCIVAAHNTDRSLTNPESGFASGRPGSVMSSRAYEHLRVCVPCGHEVETSSGDLQFAAVDTRRAHRRDTICERAKRRARPPLPHRPQSRVYLHRRRHARRDQTGLRRGGRLRALSRVQRLPRCRRARSACHLVLRRRSCSQSPHGSECATASRVRRHAARPAPRRAAASSRRTAPTRATARATERATSPVPGGMSMRRKSG